MINLISNNNTLLGLANFIPFIYGYKLKLFK